MQNIGFQWSQMLNVPSHYSNNRAYTVWCSKSCVLVGLVGRCKQCERVCAVSGECHTWSSWRRGAASLGGHTVRGRARGAVSPHSKSTLDTDSRETRTHTHQSGEQTHTFHRWHACGKYTKKFFLHTFFIKLN